MRIDRDGNELHQVSLWLPVDVIRLVRADRLNLTQFLLNQLEILYGGNQDAAVSQRNRLVDAAREVFAKQRRVEDEAEADREQARSVVRQMRAERDAGTLRREGILDALLQIVGDGPTSRYRRMLPENDPSGDRIDLWEGLVRQVSRVCGQEVEPAEVAAELRRMTVEG